MDNFTWADGQKQTAFPVARPGYPVIFAAAFTTAVFALLGLTIPAIMALAVTFFICFFFRDPDRVIPNAQRCVVSPADGKVIKAESCVNPRYYDGECIKVSIFMSVFNVHVNRISFSGIVDKILYHPGKFFSANLDKASLKNEHNAVFITTETGEKICIVQIAGLIARRILCGLQAGDTVVKGRRFGMICFGSRLDVYLPGNMKIDVRVGEKVNAGQSVLGYLP
jgi:phosphatidylserine decarboxylase